MKARLVRIGNSRGIRLPKPMIEEAGLDEDVEVTVGEGVISIRALRRPREGWGEAAREASRRGDDRLLDQQTPTRFDDTEWEWA